MNQRYFEEVKVGDCFGSNSYKVSEAQICAFAEEFDPQAFHLDAEAARKSIFQQLSASGWHTAAIAMRLFVTGELQFSGGAIGLGVDEWSLAAAPTRGRRGAARNKDHRDTGIKIKTGVRYRSNAQCRHQSAWRGGHHLHRDRARPATAGLRSVRRLLLPGTSPD